MSDFQTTVRSDHTNRSANPINPLPPLVLFDLDDTLCDYAGARKTRLLHAFAIGLHIEPDPTDRLMTALISDSLKLHPHATDHFGELFHLHGIGGDREAAIAADWYKTHRLYSLQLFADAIQTLTVVRHAVPNRRIGIVTNGPSDIQRAKIDHLGIEPYVDFIIISEEFGAWKPDRAIFLEALRRGDATPSETAFIGDSAEHDMVGASATGLHTIWINPRQLPWELDDPAPDYIAPNLDTVRQLLSGQ